jgi:hypothetical protein
LVQRKSSWRSDAGTPSISAITEIVIGAETSRTKSPPSRSAAASITSRVIRSTFASSAFTARGVNCLLDTLR